MAAPQAQPPLVCKASPSCSTAWDVPPPATPHCWERPWFLLQSSTSGHRAQDPAWPLPAGGMDKVFVWVLAEVSPGSLGSQRVLG